jgi:hypothetical protein
MRSVCAGVNQRVSLTNCAPWRVASLASNSVSVLHAVFSLYFWASL